jgi:hypothetical protein
MPLAELEADFCIGSQMAETHLLMQRNTSGIGQRDGAMRAPEDLRCQDTRSFLYKASTKVPGLRLCDRHHPSLQREGWRRPPCCLTPFR